MENTGRVTKTLSATARRIVFGETADADIDAELGPTSEADLAHCVALAERGLIPAERVRALLAHISSLRDDDFAPLRGTQAPRGLFMLYEGHLVDAIGAEAGGSLHTGRSRNDLKVAVLSLRLRERLRELTAETLRLQAILLRRAQRYAETVMPVYTHYQPAVPVTYGHYLLGIATALDRDLTAVAQAAEGLGVSPLGACGVGGTDLPLDTERVAHLLGFDFTAANSIDAVASRDTALRALFAATSLSLTTSRLATDLQLWSTQEFGLLWFPDEAVGISSIMPQKRNVFLLEHIKAKPAVVSAAAQTLVMAAKGTPFTNSIEVGTEGVSGLWTGLTATLDAVVLSRLLVGSGEPVPGRMAERARQGWTTATAMANRLVRDGVPFRQAHHRIGDLVRGAGTDGPPPQSPSPSDVVAQTEYGGGPGPKSLARQYETLRASWTRHTAAHLRWGERLRGRRAELDEAVTAIIASATHHGGQP